MPSLEKEVQDINKGDVYHERIDKIIKYCEKLERVN